MGGEETEEAEPQAVGTDDDGVARRNHVMHVPNFPEHQRLVRMPRMLERKRSMGMSWNENEIMFSSRTRDHGVSTRGEGAPLSSMALSFPLGHLTDIFHSHA